MQYTINELRQKIFQSVYDVYEIFQNFFDAQFVDLQELPTDQSIIDILQQDYELEPIEHTEDGDGAIVTLYDVSPQKLAGIKRRFNTVKPTIFVWWPRVTVTNENDRSVQIQDLYAKVSVTIEGRIPYESVGFLLNRTTFSEVQFANGYLHSHIPHFDGIPHFAQPCLGTGPIRNTIMDLKNNYEESLWMLFCQELALYVTVESLRGGPYFRLETIGSEHELYGFDEFDNAIQEMSVLYGSFHIPTDEKEQFKQRIKYFTLYYLKHGHLSLNYKDGTFIQGMTYFDFMVDISNAFIDFFNKRGTHDEVEKLFNRRIIVKAKISNGLFYENVAMTRHDFSSLEGRDMFSFKGEMKHLHIEPDGEMRSEITILLHHKIAMYILCSILKTINYRYRNEYNKLLGNSSAANIAPAYQNVIYL